MPRSSRVSFLKKDTAPCAAGMTPCPICYETTTSSITLCGLRIRLRNTKMAAKMLFSSCHRDDSTVKLRAKPSRSNYTVRIKRCGHQFCYDCLETWVQKKNTCPMCRDRLFFDAKRAKDLDDMTNGDMDPWLALREDGGMRDMNETAIMDALDDEGSYEGGRAMQDNADENEMHTGRRNDGAEAMLGQEKTE